MGEINLFRPAQNGRGCVKTQKFLTDLKIVLSDRAVFDFLGIGKGLPTHVFFCGFEFLHSLGRLRSLVTGSLQLKGVTTIQWAMKGFEARALLDPY